MSDEFYSKEIKGALNENKGLTNAQLDAMSVEAIENHVNGMANISSASEQQKIQSKASLQQVLSTVELIKTSRRLSRQNSYLQIVIALVVFLLGYIVGKH